MDELLQCILLGVFALIILLVLVPNPICDSVIEKFIEHRNVPPTTLLGSDRGSYRDYWGAPELYDAMTGYKCACHQKNKIFRDNKCWEIYDRGLDNKGLPTCLN
jgi:hypothetical protein